MHTDSDQYSQQWISNVLDGGAPAGAGDARPALPAPATLWGPGAFHADDLGSYAPVRVRSRLRRRFRAPLFQRAVRELTVRLGGRVAKGDDHRLPAVLLDVPTVTTLEVAALQLELGRSGAGLYVDAGQPDRLLLLPTDDRWEAVAAVGTGAPAAGVGPLDVVAWLATLERSHPFRLIRLGRGALGGRFRSPVAESELLARSLCTLCPALREMARLEADDEESAIRALAAHVERTGNLYLWWP